MVENRQFDFGFRISGLGLRAFNPQSAGTARRVVRNPQFSAPRPRRGMTLIELLVVIVIITTLVAAAIPLLSPANDDRRIREATRGLNTYITGAQARAVSSHRPFGIALKRLSQDTKRNDPTKLDNDNGACLEVFYVEQPAPYSGFDANSRACVALYPDQNARPGLAIVRFVTRGTTGSGMPVGWSGDLFPTNMIRPGDVIEINGTQFQLLNDTTANSNITVVNISQDPNNTEFYFAPPSSGVPQILAVPLNDSGQQIGPKYDNKGVEIGSAASLQKPYWTNPAPYKILRQAAIASDEPYQLPEGTAIDLRASGVGPDNYFYVPNIHDNDDQIQIMFTPEGRVARVTYSLGPPDNVENDKTGDLFDQAVVDNVYLLVGRRDRIAAPDVATADPTLDPTKAPKTPEENAKQKEPLNWLSGDSRWVVIGSQSGRVATIENANVDVTSFAQTYTASPFNLTASSEALRTQEIKNAREFTHEMKQVGGR
jgi:prepilin-type N-terminal cleavage/methylation domain-containing protein